MITFEWGKEVKIVRKPKPKMIKDDEFGRTSGSISAEKNAALRIVSMLLGLLLHQNCHEGPNPGNIDELGFDRG